MLLLVDIFFITLFNIVSIKNPSAIAILPLQNPKSNLLGPPRKTREENWKGSQMWANLDATRLVAKWKWKTNRKSGDFCGRLPAKHEKNEKQRQNMIKNYHESVEREAQGVRCLFLLNFFYIFVFVCLGVFVVRKKRDNNFLYACPTCESLAFPVRCQISWYFPVDEFHINLRNLPEFVWAEKLKRLISPGKGGQGC